MEDELAPSINILSAQIRLFNSVLTSVEREREREREKRRRKMR